MSTSSDNPVWQFVRAAAEAALAELDGETRAAIGRQPLRVRGRNVALEVYVGDRVLARVVAPVLDGPVPPPPSKGST